MTLWRNPRRKQPLLGIFLIAAVLAGATSCKKDADVRDFSEQAVPEPPPAASGAAPVHAMPPHGAQARFSWETPENWKELPDSSGFRLASFALPLADRETTCAIIPLQGEAGGLKANVARWMEQTGISMDSGAPLDTFLEGCERFVTRGGYPAVWVDLTPLVKKDGDRAILASVITVSGNTVFIKLFGTKSLVLENREKFRELCGSFGPASAR